LSLAIGGLALVIAAIVCGLYFGGKVRKLE